MTKRLLGVHAGLWGFDWSDSAAERAISEAADIGYDFIEIPLSDSALERSDQTRKLLDSYGISATVSLALDESSDINSTNPMISLNGESRLRDAVAFAESIGSRFVGGVIYSAMKRYLSLPTNASRTNSLDVLRRIAETADDNGITLGIEFVNRYESNLLNTVDQALSYLNELDAANAVLHLDTFHAHIEEPSLLDAVTKAGASLGYIHASESHRGLIGTGSIDWKAFAHRLTIEGNTAPIAVETFSPAVISDTDTINIGLWSRSWTDPGEAAAHSFDFLNKLLTGEEAPVSASSKARPN